MANGFGFLDPNSGFLSNSNVKNLNAEQTQYNIARRFPVALSHQYSRIADEGVFGNEGIKQIQDAYRMSRYMALRNLKNRRSAQRRLGPRSGAADRSYINSTYAPSLAGEADTMANLTAENLRSRSSVGLGGLQDILSLAMNQYMQNSAIDKQKPSTFEKIADGLAQFAPAAAALL